MKISIPIELVQELQSYEEIKEFLALKKAQKAELEKQWVAEQISTREFQESMTALDMETDHLKL